MPLPETTRPGYSFEGWYSDSLDGVLYEDEYVAQRNNTTVYARWTGDFTVTFDTRGGYIDSKDKEITVRRGGAVTLPETNRSGFWFEGWYSDPKAGVLYGRSGDEYVNIIDDIIMYARWKSILYMDEGDSVINGIVCVFVEAGIFTMGSPPNEPGRYFDEVQREVTLTKNYWISKYPVTNRQFGRDVPAGQEDHPVVNVNWDEARSFAQGKNGGLPTEAQWEFAARGGNKAAGYKVYSGSDILNEAGWYLDNSDGRTHAVGSENAAARKRSNELGIYDMTGNVKEWCSDWYNIFNSQSVTDPLGPASGAGRIYRGGGFRSEARDCRIADRPYIDPTARRNDLGFRIIFPDN